MKGSGTLLVAAQYPSCEVGCLVRFGRLRGLWHLLSPHASYISTGCARPDETRLRVIIVIIFWTPGCPGFRRGPGKGEAASRFPRPRLLEGMRAFTGVPTGHMEYPRYLRGTSCYPIPPAAVSVRYRPRPMALTFAAALRSRLCSVPQTGQRHRSASAGRSSLT